MIFLDKSTASICLVELTQCLHKAAFHVNLFLSKNRGVTSAQWGKSRLSFVQNYLPWISLLFFFRKKKVFFCFLEATDTILVCISGIFFFIIFSLIYFSFLVFQIFFCVNVFVFCFAFFFELVVYVFQFQTVCLYQKSRSRFSWPSVQEWKKVTKRCKSGAAQPFCELILIGEF